LIDTGIGMHDVRDPQRRIGSAVIDAAGYKLLPDLTAVRQLESRGITASAVTDIVLTHCDTDHVGGLSDFPSARVHLSSEEKENVDGSNPRYTRHQFAHGPRWHTYSTNDSEVLGLPSRQVRTSADIDIRLVPLFGHTYGHCGVAVRDGSSWVLHVGDAYYLRAELTNEQQPISQLAALRADNNELRVKSLDTLRWLTRRTDCELAYCGYHDFTELPRNIPLLDGAA